MRAEPARGAGCQKEEGDSVIRLHQSTLETRLSYSDAFGGTEWGLLVGGVVCMPHPAVKAAAPPAASPVAITVLTSQLDGLGS
jgi:hypothetical protein